MSRPLTPALSLAQRSLILAASLTLTTGVVAANLGLASHYASGAETVTLQAHAVPAALHGARFAVASSESRQR